MAASGFGLPASRLQGVEPSCQTVGLCNILVLMLTLVFDIRVVFQGEFRPFPWLPLFRVRHALLEDRPCEPIR